MRTLTMVLGTSLLAMTALAYWLGQQAQQQEQLAGDLARQVERLLDEVESATRQRLENERNLTRLTGELARARAGTVSTAPSPAIPTDEAEAALRAREVALRERLEREYRERLEAGSLSQATGPAELLAQLSALDNDERMALIGVQSQYGAFLDSLAVSEERKQRISEALLDLTLSRNQTRADLRSQRLPPEEMAREIMALMSPEATREILAYDLTDEELAAFEAFQEQQGGRIVTGTAGGNSVFMLRSESGAPGTFFQQGDDLVIDAAGDPAQGQRVIIRNFAPPPPALP